MLRPLPERAPTPALDGAPPTIGGKFFFVGDHKLYLRGVSYGPFADADHGFPFPDRGRAGADLELMAEIGANASGPSPSRRAGCSTARPSTASACW